MGKFLVEETIEACTITADAIKRIDTELNDIISQYNKGKEDINTRLLYLIRFDGKGYIVDDIDSLLKYFSDAQTVERIVFEVSDITTERNEKTIAIYLNNNIQTLSSFVVTNDCKEWTEGTFYRLKGILSKYQNSYSWVRNWKVEAFVQITAVLLMFFCALYLAVKTCSMLNVEHPFLISFIGWLLLFSNCWTYTMLNLRTLMSKIFPVVAFKENKLKKYLQNIVLSVIVAPFAIYLLANIFQYFKTVVTTIFR